MLPGSRNRSTTRHAGRAKDIETNAPHTLSPRQISARIFEPEPALVWTPARVVRMRWKTYRRVRQQYDELRGRWTSVVMARFGIKV
jgi:hypothetical protein